MIIRRTWEDFSLPVNVVCAKRFGETIAELLLADNRHGFGFYLTALAETFHWSGQNKATMLVQAEGLYYRCYGELRDYEYFVVTDYRIVGADTNIVKELH